MGVGWAGDGQDDQGHLPSFGRFECPLQTTDFRVSLDEKEPPAASWLGQGLLRLTPGCLSGPGGHLLIRVLWPFLTQLQSGTPVHFPKYQPARFRTKGEKVKLRFYLLMS